MTLFKGLIAWAILLTASVVGMWVQREVESLASLWDSAPSALVAEDRGTDRSPFKSMTQHQVEDVFREHLRFSERTSSSLARHLLEVCQKHALKPALVLALIKAESSFKPHVVSNRGAIGLMQLMPDTAQYISKRWSVPYTDERDLLNPFKNISLGVTYLAYLRDKYRGSLHHMLAAYNIGPGKVDKLIAENRFRVNKTRPYIESIREGVEYFRGFGLPGVGSGFDVLEAMDIESTLKKSREPNV